MTKAQFALLTAALGLATMGGAGYYAYASTTPNTSGTNAAASGQRAGSATGGIPVPTGGASIVAGTGAGKGSTAYKSGVPECGNGDVQVSESSGQGAAGHLSLLLIFQNVSGHECFLHGYPGAALSAQGGGNPLNATRSLSGYLGGAVGLKQVPYVFLDAAGKASAVLEWSDVQNGSAPGGCVLRNPVSLVVTPPNFTQSSTLTFAGSPVCSGFEVHPVLTGVVSQPVG